MKRECFQFSKEEAEAIRKDWEAGLSRLNEHHDGIMCIIACGMAYGTKGYDLETLLSEADKMMYEDKIKKKNG